MLDELLKTKTRQIRDLSSDDLLSVLGLERRHSAFDNAVPTSLAFLAGLAAGAGIALLLAPKSGREVRQDISNRASELTGRIGTAASELASDARAAIGTSTERTEPNRSLSGGNRTS
jgi:hypothetical protein